MLAKSLGRDGMLEGMLEEDALATLRRRSSDTACIFHSGYLLKRSNQPITSRTDESGGPPMVPDASLDEEGLLASGIGEAAATVALVGGAMDDFAAGLPAPPLTSDDTDTADTATAAESSTRSTADTNALTDLVAALAFAGSGDDDDERDKAKEGASTQEGTAAAAAAAAAVAVSTTKIITAATSAAPTPEGQGGAIPIPVPAPPTTPSYHRLNSAPVGIHPTTVQTTDMATNYTTASVHTVNNNKNDADLTSTPAQIPQPADYIAPDGHIWRAKFCVLEDGVLYFYRNEEVGNSIEAQIEREQTSLFQYQPQPPLTGDSYHDSEQQQQQRQSIKMEDLSKSPMPRKLGLLDSHDHAGATSFCHDGSVLWEKRVCLDHVGEVRSAEMEYGKKSFELLAVGYEDNPNALDESIRRGDADAAAGQSADRLILRAGSKEEMNEWLFQFHRSLASFMKQIVNMVGSTVSGVGDLHLPVEQYYPDAGVLPPLSAHSSFGSFGAAPIPGLKPPAQKSKNDNFDIVRSYSPGSQLAAAFPESALSHGHGRSGMHRRRVRSRQSSDYSRMHTASPLSTPGAGTSPDISVDDWAASSASASVGRVSKRGGIATSLDSKASVGSPPRGTPPRDELELHPPRVHRVKELSPKKKEEDARRLPPSAGKYIPPHLRPKKEGTSTSKYIPPHLRNKGATSAKPPVEDDLSTDGMFDLADEDSSRDEGAGMNHSNGFGIESINSSAEEASKKRSKAQSEESPHFMLGGCADPTAAIGSIEDDMYVPKKASRVGKFRTKGHGGFSFSSNDEDSDGMGGGGMLRWEVGAMSECGIRESNEDAYIISHDMSAAFSGWREHHREASNLSGAQHYGLFAIFDGHCGNHAARYASERLPALLFDEYKKLSSGDDSASMQQHAENMLTGAILRLDEEFCMLCYAGGRDWESGATALVVLLVDDLVTIANLGDSKGVMCMSKAHHNGSDLNGWSVLEENEPSADMDIDGTTIRYHVLWKEVSDAHFPGRDDERERIERANGWITTETEIPISQLQRIDFLDADVVEILRRCFSDRFDDDPSSDVHRAGKKCSAEPGRLLHISRVCGELAVSRAIGDRDFKAAFNKDSDTDEKAGSDGNVGDSSDWESPLFLPYPEDHSRRFEGDLVSALPEFQHLRAGMDGHMNEFLLLACDGLWDVMDADDAVRVARGLLFDKGWTAQKTAARLAELATHLGSSDNITVIVVRFFTDD